MLQYISARLDHWIFNSFVIVGSIRAHVRHNGMCTHETYIIAVSTIRTALSCRLIYLLVIWAWEHPPHTTYEVLSGVLQSGSGRLHLLHTDWFAESSGFVPSMCGSRFVVVHLWYSALRQVQWFTETKSRSAKALAYSVDVGKKVRGYLPNQQLPSCLGFRMRTSRLASLRWATEGVGVVI